MLKLVGEVMNFITNKSSYAWKGETLAAITIRINPEEQWKMTAIYDYVFKPKLSNITCIFHIKSW